MTSGKINREELAWAAGFFDGEGWAGIILQRPQTAPSMAPVMRMAQVDRRALDRFQAAVLGLGKINGPYTRKNRKDQPQFTWASQNFQSTQAVIAMLYQFLSPVKQTQCLKALRTYGEWYVNYR